MKLAFSIDMYDVFKFRVRRCRLFLSNPCCKA